MSTQSDDFHIDIDSVRASMEPILRPPKSKHYPKRTEALEKARVAREEKAAFRESVKKMRMDNLRRAREERAQAKEAVKALRVEAMRKGKEAKALQIQQIIIQDDLPILDKETGRTRRTSSNSTINEFETFNEIPVETAAVYQESAVEQQLRTENEQLKSEIRALLTELNASNQERLRLENKLRKIRQTLLIEEVERAE